MIYVYPLDPSDNVEKFTLEKLMQKIHNEEVYIFEHLNVVDLYHSDLLAISKPRAEFIIYDAEYKELKYVWLEIKLDVLKEKILSKIIEERSNATAQR